MPSPWYTAEIAQALGRKYASVLGRLMTHARRIARSEVVA
mgnify:CR=1 FL=1